MAPSAYANASFPRRSLHHKLEYEAFIDRVHTSGSPVAEHEICRIENAVLPGINQDVASINGSIASLQSILDAMKEERAALKSLEKSYKNFVPPYRAIPCDIWHEIFAHTLAVEPSNSCQASGPIWRLSQVCQTWRNVALSYYSAWCTIELDFMERDVSEHDTQILELVLQRSHQRLLSVTLFGCCRERDNDLVRVPLEILFAESHRWQSLNLTEFDPLSLYESLRGRLPQLESLIIYSGDRAVLHIFNDCPRLTRVSLPAHLPDIDLPVAQLTELCLQEESESGWSVDDVGAYWHLVEECVSLQTLRISCMVDAGFDGEDDFSSLSMITLPNISKIDIDCMELMDKLTLPRLQEAALAHDYSCRAPIYSLHQFEELLHRSNCAGTISNLKIHDVSLRSWDSNASLHYHLLRDLLSQTTNLHTLDLCFEMLRGGRPDALTVAQITEVVEALNEIAFLPCLSSLRIDLQGHMSSTVTYFGHTGFFVSMVKARWEGHRSPGLCRLETLHFSVTSERLWKVADSNLKPPGKIHHGFSDAELDILRALVKERMDLSLRFSGREIL